jgi:hypothetical protein
MIEILREIWHFVSLLAVVCFALAFIVLSTSLAIGVSFLIIEAIAR